MSYNIYAQEYRYFKRLTDRKYASDRNPTRATSDTMSEEDYSKFTGFHHEDSLYQTTPAPRKPGYRKHTPGYEKRFTIDNNQTFITLNKNGTFNVSGQLSAADRLIIEESIDLLPTGLTLTLTEVFKKIS